MSRYSLSHLSDPTLLHELRSLVAQDRATTAAMLAHLAEVDARKLYLPAAHPSMYSYCVNELRLSEDAACKRIQAARTARRFPVIFEALADGRLHLSAIVMLAPYLAEANAAELLTAAAGKTRPELEQLLAERFPRPELMAWVQPVAAQQADRELSAPGRIESAAGSSAPARIAPLAERTRVAPIGAERFALQLTIGKSMHDKLRYAQELLGHAVASGEVGEVLDRALDALIHQLERRRFAATDKLRPRRRRSSANPRHIPADVKRAVWQRDGGQCTFVSDAGHRCPARTRLEFDHVQEVARGGQASVAGIRLRCRAHNQYGAECAFGAGFMERKREQARARMEAMRAGRAGAGVVPGFSAAEAAEARGFAKAAPECATEVIPWLRQLGFRADEARRGASACEGLVGVPLEERVRVALGSLSPGRARTISPGRAVTASATMTVAPARQMAAL